MLHSVALPGLCQRDRMREGERGTSRQTLRERPREGQGAARQTPWAIERGSAVIVSSSSGSSFRETTEKPEHASPSDDLLPKGMSFFRHSHAGVCLLCVCAPGLSVLGHSDEI